MTRHFRMFFFALTMLFLLASKCKKDKGTEFKIRDRKEQYAKEKDSILHFLQTHTYTVDADYNFHLDTLTDPNTQTSLYDAAQMVQMNDTVVDDLVYDIYYIPFRQGTELPVTTCDNVLEAFTVQDFKGVTYFHNPELNPTWTGVWFPSVGGTSALGLRAVYPLFKSGTFTANPDGTVSFDNYGAGVVFLPSGLFGTFGLATSSELSGTTLDAYSPVIVSFKILHVNQDIDEDNVPNTVEDLNGDGNPFNDNTDKEEETKNHLPHFPNFTDPDDDGDHIRTKYEDPNGNGDPTDDDTDGDGIPNYLDKDTH